MTDENVEWLQRLKNIDKGKKIAKKSNWKVFLVSVQGTFKCLFVFLFVCLFVLFYWFLKQNLDFISLKMGQELFMAL